MSETQEAKQSRWDREWDSALEGAKSGNPFATLCSKCFGRHRPPNDDECPNVAPTKET